MITLIKLLVLLFLSVLGYDTINLFLLKTFNNEARELATVIQNEEPLTSYSPVFVSYSIENKILIIFLTSIVAIIVIILLFKKRHRDEGIRIAQIVSQLKNLNESTKNVDLSINCDNEDIIEEETNYESDNENNLIDETQSTPTSRNSLDESKSSEESDSDQSQQRNKFLVTKPISTTPMFTMPCTDAVNLFENETPIEEQKIELSNEAQRNYYFTYGLNVPRHLFYRDSLRMKNLFPGEDNEILRNCECNINKFQERLEEVECNLRSTKEVTILWRNRIEQTEEELLELQQQIHAIILEKTFSKLSYLEENKRNKNELVDYSFIFPNLGSFKPLQTISNIIEETKKQVEEEEEEQEGEKPFTIETAAEETLINSQDVSYCSTVSSEADLRMKEQISDSYNQNNIIPEEVTELSENQEELNRNELKNEEEEQIQNEKSEEPIYETPPETATKINDNKENDNSSLPEVQIEASPVVMETIFEYNLNAQTKKKLNTIAPKVPSHIVDRRLIPSKRPKRPQPRCAYSVLTEPSR